MLDITPLKAFSMNKSESFLLLGIDFLTNYWKIGGVGSKGQRMPFVSASRRMLSKECCVCVAAGM
jgi:hypothetical protein